MSTTSQGFGDLLREHRLAAGLTQEELAERARLSARAVSDLERGVKTHPRASTVRQLADGLGLSSDERAQLQEASRPDRRSVPLPDQMPHSLPAGSAQKSLPTAPARPQRRVLSTVPARLAVVILVIGAGVLLGARFFRPASAISASLHGPDSLVADAQGNVFVSDQGNDRIVEFNSSGVPIHSWGTSGTASLQFNSPGSVTLAPNGALYVADTGNKRVQVLRGGRQVDEITHNGGSLALDSKSRLFATDYLARQIRVFDPDGTPAGTLSIPEVHVGPHPFPAGIAIDGRGNLYIADREKDRIVKLSPSGTMLATFGHRGSGVPQGAAADPEFDLPSDVVVDRSGRIYVADTHNNRIQILSPSGKVLNIIPHAGPHQVHLYQPVSIALDGHGNIYVADYYDNRIEKLSPSGMLVWSKP